MTGLIVVSIAIALAGNGGLRDGFARGSPEGLRYDVAGSASQDCGEWTECRRLALEAAERKEYELFHDLAWRAVQLGPKNDPAMLFLLARAQSLSGRPHDALVMLRRIASSGAAREALTSPEFERVRALKDWPEAQPLLAPPGSEPASASAPPAAAPPKPDRIARPAAPAVPSDPAPAAASAAAAPDPLLFAAASFKPAALAYDAVSRRFIVGDTDVSRLAVIDEFSRHLATLASGRPGGFGAVTAIEIDPREGDLWVAGMDGSSGEDVPVLHRLQLISARVLKKVAVAAKVKMPAERIADLAVAPDGAVYAVQEGGTVWRVPAGRSLLQLVARGAGTGAAGIAVSSQGAIYIARADGLLRLRPVPSTKVTAGKGVDLSGLVRIRWSQGSLVGVQRSTNGAYRVIRVRLGRGGRAATSLEELDPSVRMPNPAAATLAGGIFYYVAETGGTELAIRRVAVR